MTEIRKARTADVPAMAAIINEAAERGRMLHRSLAELYDRLRDFQVAVDQTQRVLGVGGLRVMWANLAELYALAVAGEARRQGLGRRLTEACVAEARSLGLRRVFALTYEQSFFTQCGFTEVQRGHLPVKVWSECVRCPKREACDEVAMLRELADVPDHTPPVDPNHVDGDYEVPVTINHRHRPTGP